MKIPSGGWFPIVIGISVFTLLTTWKKGRIVLMRRLSDGSLPLDVFIESIELDPPTRVPGTAVFLTSGVNSVPHSLLHNLKHNKVLHERVVFLTIVARDIPYVPLEERYEIKPLGGAFLQITRVLRLLGRPRRAAPARTVRPRRVRVRDDGNVVLRIARIADRDRRARHGQVARAIVRVDVEERDESV